MRKKTKVSAGFHDNRLHYSSSRHTIYINLPPSNIRYPQHKAATQRASLIQYSVLVGILAYDNVLISVFCALPMSVYCPISLTSSFLSYHGNEQELQISFFVFDRQNKHLGQDDLSRSQTLCLLGALKI